MPVTTRGPLPAGVYWRRRVFVVLLAVGLVFVVGNWLVGWSDGADSDVGAEQVVAVEEPTHTVTPDPSEGPRKAERRERREAALAEPSGPCEDADVLIRPSVASAVAGRPVTITLSLQTRSADACNWRIGPQQVAVRITSGSREIWNTRHCKPIEAQRLVLRKSVATEVEFTWNARESDDGCPKATEWVLPGDFTIAAAALGGEPATATFELSAPQQQGKDELEAQRRKGNALERVDQR